MEDTLRDDIKNYYEKWWENPDDPRDMIFKQLNAVVLEKLPPGKRQKALDVGAGKGTIVNYLRQKGYRVTAVELNEKFAQDLKLKFPDVEVVPGDFNAVSLNGNFSLVSAIEFIQNLDREALQRFFKKVGTLTNHVILSVSNKNSLHGFWAVFRGFIKPFVHVYTPQEVERMLRAAGFKITNTKGIGFLTPITLLSNFRFQLVPKWLVKIVNPIADRIFPKWCHLYYLEAKKREGRE